MAPGPDFLAPGGPIDSDHRQIMARARSLGGSSAVEQARLTFEWVQNKIPHSLDIQGRTLARTASEALHLGHGFCYVKSFLLAALLRAQGIPAGLAYQRLRDGQGGFALHGLNAIWLKGRWCLVDARGNNEEVHTWFDLDRFVPAYLADRPGEGMIEGVFAQPLPEVIAALESADDVAALVDAYPDRPL